MALKDMMKDMANAAVSQAQSAVQDAIDRDQQTINGQGTSGVVQGVMGHYSELSAESAQQQYGMYLMRGESFTRCFALVRDKMLFTDRRIVFIDHQGMTGAKAAAVSIDLQSIVGVRLETARTTRSKACRRRPRRLSSRRTSTSRVSTRCSRSSHTRTCAASTHRKEEAPRGHSAATLPAGLS